MRRILLFALVATSLLAAALPAHAKPVRSTSTYGSANAFWYDAEQVGRNTVRYTTWYVGAYDGEWGASVDVYQDVAECRTTGRNESCTWTSRWGWADLAPGQFSLAGDLSSARLEASVDLYTFDQAGRRQARPETVSVVTEWTGTGDLERNRGSFSYRSSCFSYRETFRGAFRSAEAVGSVGDTDLGATVDAYLSNSTSRTFERSC